MDKRNETLEGSHCRTRCRMMLVRADELRNFFGVPASPVADPRTVEALRPERIPVLHAPVVAITKPGELELQAGASPPEIVEGFDLVQAAATLAVADRVFAKATLAVWLGELPSYAAQRTLLGLVDGGNFVDEVAEPNATVAFRAAVRLQLAHHDPEMAVAEAEVPTGTYLAVTAAYLDATGLDRFPGRRVGETAILWCRLVQAFGADLGRMRLDVLLDASQRLARARGFRPRDW